MSLRGIELFSTTKTSRLAQWFPVASVSEAFYRHDLGLDNENLEGCYSKTFDDSDMPFHRDIKPYDWKNNPRFKNTDQDKKKGDCGCNKKKVEQNKEERELDELNGVVLDPKGMLDKIEHVRMNDIVLEEVL